MENKKKLERRKIYYICFYAEPEISNKIVSYPSVWSKMDYIVLKLKQCGFKIELLSVAVSTGGAFKGFRKKFDGQETHLYLSSYRFKNFILNKMSTVWHWLKIITYLLIKVKSDDIVLVYHSIYNLRWLNIYNGIFHKEFYLEIEDIFSALNEKNQHFMTAEWNLFKKAKGCICVNDLIAEKLQKVSKIKTIISYGSYLLPAYKKKKVDNRIHLVYAGVIEQDRKAAFLAVNAMKYLPLNYSLSVLGFGEQEDIDALIKLIEKVKRKTNNSNINFYGRMSGKKYYEFLQKCDIGLSTHMYDEFNKASADNTFPSKVLVYMANGLRVVAQNIRCLQKSELNKYIFFYENPEEEKVAEAIKRINIDSSYDGRKVISKLDEKFEINLRQFFAE